MQSEHAKYDEKVESVKFFRSMNNDRVLLIWYSSLSSSDNLRQCCISPWNTSEKLYFKRRSERKSRIKVVEMFETERFVVYKVQQISDES